ncbi:MAG: DNA polymerase domain-containing protein, partial [Nitrososphaerales archaeon]
MPYTFEPGITPNELRRFETESDWRLGSLVRRYPRFSADRKVADENNLEWVTPGHALFEALRRNAVDHARSSFSSGATYYSIANLEATRLDIYRARVVDGLGITVHERLFAIEVMKDKSPVLRDPWMIGNLVPAKIPDQMPEVASAHEPRDFLDKFALAPFLEEVQKERVSEINRVARYVEIALTELISREDEKIGKLTEERDKGAEGFAGLLAQAESRQSEFVNRRDRRRRELARQAQLTLQNVERLASVLVLPYPDLDKEELRRLRPNSENRLVDLDVHICKRKLGIVPESLGLPLSKRFEYKKLRDEASDPWLKQVYNERAGALKWVLVTSFGYLSFRHAKFMKIDAHIAVCSVARQTLLDAMHTAENRGFRVIHGIIDSLWVHKDRTTREDYQELREEIEKATKFKLAIEGIYKWIVFLPSKVDSQNQVPTRYFGCFEKNNEMKVRGIEYRRHDTPIYFKKCQELILKELSKCDTEVELREVARKRGIQMFYEFAKQIEDHDVPPLELLITRRLSKNLGDYFSKRQLSVSAALKLEGRGLELKAGQAVSYVITKYKTAGMNRALPQELAEDAEYD